MNAVRSGWGWAGSVRELLGTPPETWVAALEDHHRELLGTPPSGSQRAAWDGEYSTMRDALRDCCVAVPAAESWGLVFEFELPLEGGRRPDVVVLAGATVVVLEFKSSGVPLQSFVDQVAAYASDLTEFHAETHGRPVVPIVVLAGADDVAEKFDEVVATDPTGLAHYLFDSYSPGMIDLSTWLNAPYTPLPTLVAAARRIFRHEPLPHVKRALAAGIPETVELLGSLIQQSESVGARMMAFVTGVPGSGKTLVGLRVVYERSGERATATFLSGNGPLVKVLQDALGSRVFVRDLHAFIRTFGQTERIPDQHVLVFDEAQRAWDRSYMDRQRGVAASEPDLLVKIAERLPGWAALVGLVGDGQEIHSGEEAGMPQWREAARGPNAGGTWTIHCPPRLASEFSGLEVHTHDRLDLTVSLRSRRAERLHDWVAQLLNGSLPLAAQRAVRIHAQQYPLYLTRDLDDARSYARVRYADEPEKRYGLLSSSHAKVLPKFGVDNSFMATSRVLNIARWFNAPRDDPKSCCALSQPVTEFGCQGLELDLPIVCWGEDYRWTGSEWSLTPVRRKYRQEDPQALLENAYRVLLTRGRDGLVIFVPDDPRLDQTEHALLAAGMRPLPQSTEDVQAALG